MLIGTTSGSEFAWGPNAQLALDTIAMRPTRGIPTGSVNVMDIPLIEELAGRAPGDPAREPEEVYVAYKRNIGVFLLDQYIPTNALSMTRTGYDSSQQRGATTGIERVVPDGMDYQRICGMADRRGGPLLIWAGVSVTRALPFGTREKVRDELRRLVEAGPPIGLILGASISAKLATNLQSFWTLIDGLRYYREHGCA